LYLPHKCVIVDKAFFLKKASVDKYKGRSEAFQTYITTKGMFRSVYQVTRMRQTRLSRVSTNEIVAKGRFNPTFFHSDAYWYVLK
jgi:hypothetical protein